MIDWMEDYCPRSCQLSRGPVNKIVHHTQRIQWQLTEFSSVEKRQSAANPSPPEEEFASFTLLVRLTYDRSRRKLAACRDRFVDIFLLSAFRFRSSPVSRVFLGVV